MLYNNNDNNNIELHLVSETWQKKICHLDACFKIVLHGS